MLWKLNKLQAPCKDCEDRHCGCHDKCPQYLAYKKKLDDIRAKKFAEGNLMYDVRKRKRRDKWLMTTK